MRDMALPTLPGSYSMSPVTRESIKPEWVAQIGERVRVQEESPDGLVDVSWKVLEEYSGRAHTQRPHELAPASVHSADRGVCAPRSVVRYILEYRYYGEDSLHGPEGMKLLELLENKGPDGIDVSELEGTGIREPPSMQQHDVEVKAEVAGGQQQDVGIESSDGVRRRLGVTVPKPVKLGESFWARIHVPHRTWAQDAGCSLTGVGSPHLAS